MVKDANKWVDDTVDVSQLKLDLQNPRLPKHVKDHNDETPIRDYLLEKENITRIARNIVSNGYHHSAVSITYKDTDGKLIVLDGNRRLAASQLLSDPKLISTAKSRKEYETLAQQLPAGGLSSIKVAIAPSRKAAEKEIWDIHVSPLAKPWEVLQKLRMYRNLIETGDYSATSAAHEYGITESKFKKELARLYFYEQLLEITDNAGEEELLKSGFNKIDRLIISDNGKKLLGYSIDDDGNVIPKDSKELEARLVKLEPFITNPSLVKAQVTQDELTRNVYSTIDSKMFPSTQPPAAPVVTKPGAAKPATTSKTPTNGTLARTDWITEAEYRDYKGADRVKDMLKELKKNPPVKGDTLNIVAVSLRVVIELAIYDALKKKGHIQTIITAQKADVATKNAQRATTGKPLLPLLKPDWTPSLAIMMGFMLQEANGIITDPQERKALTAVVAKKKDFMNDLNSYVHNVSFVTTESEVKDIWMMFGRPIFDIIKKI
jgi:hypothetical protein